MKRKRSQEDEYEEENEDEDEKKDEKEDEDEMNTQRKMMKIRRFRFLQSSHDIFVEDKKLLDNPEIFPFVQTCQKVYENYMKSIFFPYFNLEPSKDFVAPSFCYYEEDKNLENLNLVVAEHYEIVSMDDYDIIELFRFVETPRFYFQYSWFLPCLNCSYFDQLRKKPVYVLHDLRTRKKGLRVPSNSSRITPSFCELSLKRWLMQLLWYNDFDSENTRCDYYSSWLPEEVLLDILDLFLLSKR
jgi:hypothetical protein